MDRDLVAEASITISAPASRVFDALTNPNAIKQYMFGTTVVSDWKEGSPIVWKGEWQGKKYEDKGQILAVQRDRLLRYSHFSPLMGLEDRPENYHRVTITLSPDGNGTRVTLSQDNNADEAARDHSAKNWSMMLGALKQFVEKPAEREMRA